jgi:hypothetical protein
MDEQAYNKRFPGFAGALIKAKAEGKDIAMIDSPKVLGSSYREIVHGLELVAASGLTLFIVPQSARPHGIARGLVTCFRRDVRSDKVLESRS